MTREEFNALPHELQNKARSEYAKLYPGCEDLDCPFYIKQEAGLLELLFGKENLILEPQIRTWDDLVKAGKAYVFGEVITEDVKLDDTFNETPAEKKALATLKIAQLIDVAYGGMVSTQEQIKIKDTFYHIVVCGRGQTHNEGQLFVDCFIGCDEPNLLCFHTRKQAEDFLKYNEQLIKDYYML